MPDLRSDRHPDALLRNGVMRIGCQSRRSPNSAHERPQSRALRSEGKAAPRVIIDWQRSDRSYRLEAV